MPITLHGILCKRLYLINEYMVHSLLMLEVLFIQDSKLEDLIFGASSGSESSLFFSNSGADCSPVLLCHHNSHG